MGFGDGTGAGLRVTAGVGLATIAATGGGGGLTTGEGTGTTGTTVPEATVPWRVCPGGAEPVKLDGCREHTDESEVGAVERTQE